MRGYFFSVWYLDVHSRIKTGIWSLDCTSTLVYAKIPMLGGVGEWLKPPDCKSGVRKGFAGSNPAPSTKTFPGPVRTSARADQ